jgi:antitoxin VapB
LISFIEIYHRSASEGDMDRARVFWSGRSQAVRLPKEYRFDGSEVRIRRRGAAVILEPIPADWSWLDQLTASGPADPDFVEAVEESVAEEERAGLDRLFE